jgi:hypothetical protein
LILAVKYGRLSEIANLGLWHWLLIGRRSEIVGKKIGSFVVFV